MRKSILRLAALLLVCLLLAACTGDGLIRLKYEDGKFVNASKKLSYIPAPVSYEPTSVGEAYAYYERGNITMYEISGVSPTLWLTEEYADTATTVFYSDTITLPTLADFGAERIYACVSEERTYVEFTIEDALLIASIVELTENGEAAEEPMGDLLLSYDMKFSSPAWPMIYINLEYEEYEDGAYLYNRNTRKYTALGDLLTEIVHEGES